MDRLRLIGPRLTSALLAALFVVGFGIPAALAQSASCPQLFATLQQLNRNGDFRNTDAMSEDARALQADERDSESAYIRSGCQSDQQQGYPQTGQCRALGRQILQQRARLKQMAGSLANGSAIAQQREQVLQQIARFGCNQQGARPRTGFFSDSEQDQPPPRHRNFLQDLFGGFQRDDASGQGDDGYGDNYNGQEQVEDPYAQQPTGNTIRTVCVRLSDGYYWPISYSTVRDYIPQDAETCAAECPGQQVNLYFYDNPGQEPEQMIDAEGQPYSSLPNAFAYRKQFDEGNTCKPQVTTGQISMQDLGDGSTRAMIAYDGESFPLPLRDPRRTARVIAAPADVAEAAVDIPLPRPRPNSTAAAPDKPPAEQPVISARSRLVKVGNKIVRVVGPDTPYAPATGNSG